MNPAPTPNVLLKRSRIKLEYQGTVSSDRSMGPLNDRLVAPHQNWPQCLSLAPTNTEALSDSTHVQQRQKAALPCATQPQILSRGHTKFTIAERDCNASQTKMPLFFGRVQICPPITPSMKYQIQGVSLMMKRRSFLKAAAAGLLVFPAAGSALAQTPFAPEDIKVPPRDQLLSTFG